MKLFAVLIFQKAEQNAFLLYSNMDLSFANYFIQNTIKEHIIFHCRLVCTRTGEDERQTVKVEKVLGKCHVYVNSNGLAGAVVADDEYPVQVAYTLLNKLLKSFTDAHGKTIKEINKDTKLDFEEGDKLIKLYQKPMEADKLFKIQTDLDEIKEVMMKNLDELLERGEKLDDLMQKTSDLSDLSVKFYRTAKRQNQCCQLY